MTTATETTAELAARYGKAWNTQDLDGIISMHSEDGLFHLHAEAEAVTGVDAIRQAFAGFLAQFPDINFAEQQLIVGDGG